MALGRAFSVAVTGVDGQLVEIEADVGRGLPGVSLVGLPDTALSEARDRIRAAVTNSGEKWPESRVTLALSPAMLPKVGSVYDLALAIAALNASGELPDHRLAGTILLGELALDGRVRAVRGVLPAVLAARTEGFARVVVPVESLTEAALVDDIEVFGAETLRHVCQWLRGEGSLVEPTGSVAPSRAPGPDLVDIVGQVEARWAAEVSAAGGHNMMLVGPPGTGKTMIAQRIPGLLPVLSERESIEVSAIHSVAGILDPKEPLVTNPPFVAPHHTSTITSLIGGGTGMARPGAVSRAHRGILFLDECPEFGTRVLDALRTPIEEGEVRIARRDGVARYPARFQLILAANPCPCAAAKDKDCTCQSTLRSRYLGRISGPLMDRVDLKIVMRPEASGRLLDADGEPTSVVRSRVVAARCAAAERWQSFGWTTNAEVPGNVLRGRFRPSNRAIADLETGMRRGLLTARGADRTLRVAWSICDLRGGTALKPDDVASALMFRERGSA
ncbi:YifB family Mg chelatase-like AAA ATPase [Smaragdicoccus niigatensis]|uniref:YifB family Mg chelatase-like AAA ATPase n=1 Tax=Smaragdicoccus niigatensis TaxID=359359 RepID=UPI0003700E09|nr:YifB family Mg chelatase-like AAA ATPase [Smaragdicoccus niigatensis]